MQIWREQAVVLPRAVKASELPIQFGSNLGSCAGQPSTLATNVNCGRVVIVSGGLGWKCACIARWLERADSSGCYGRVQGNLSHGSASSLRALHSLVALARFGMLLCL
eukprot:2176697-Amphidinium_carterae.1